MPSLWNDRDASACTDALELRAYSSRLLGADPDLVLLGGGNTSLKSTWRQADGRSIDCLYVKGSGSDLSRVGPADFTPLVLEPARRLLDLEHLDTDAMMAALAPLKLRADAPRPSIETLLHASVPFTHVEHTHADNVLAVANTASGRRVVAEVFGDLAPLVPFHHSGFELAKACMETWRRARTDRTIGLILEFHGAVAFADDARTAYENMLALADRAETYLRQRDAWDLRTRGAPPRSAATALDLARLRREVSAIAGFPMVLAVDADPEVMGFLDRTDLKQVALQGPPTPQHAVFTKRLPALGCDVQRYATDYRSYLDRFAPAAATAASLPDPAPRIILDPAFGLVAASVDAHHARMTAEVYRHDIRIASRAAAHDRYVCLPPEAILLAEIHYGGFDRALRAQVATRLPRLGTVVLAVDASREQIENLIAQGAAIIIAGGSAELGDERSVHVIDGPLGVDALIEAVYAFGGIDAVIGDAGNVEAPGLLDELLASSPVPAR